MLRTQFAAFALAAAALATSGCGSSKAGSATTGTATTTTTTTTTSSTSTSPATFATGKPLTRAQLIARGDAICASTNAKFAAIIAKTRPEFVHLLPQAAVYLGTEAEGLSRLVPPTSMSGDWTQIVNNIHFASEYVTRVARYFQEKQEKAANQLYEKANKLNSQSEAIAKGDGFKHCSRFR
jgi:hypothetical protein